MSLCCRRFRFQASFLNDGRQEGRSRRLPIEREGDVSQRHRHATDRTKELDTERRTGNGASKMEVGEVTRDG